MADLRCPDCQLILFFPDGIPNERQQCPACGALYEWDETTGILTLFYEKEEDVPDGDGTEVQEESGQEQDDVPASPDEMIAELERKIDRIARDPTRRGRSPFRVTFTLVCGSLILSFLVFSIVHERFSWGEMLGFSAFAALVGFMAGLPVAAIYFLLEKSPPERADFYDFAARAEEGKVVRRPLPPPDRRSPTADADDTAVTPHPIKPDGAATQQGGDSAITPQLPPPQAQDEASVTTTRTDDPLSPPA